jgi:signal transduction histidine kinase
MSVRLWLLVAGLCAFLIAVAAFSWQASDTVATVLDNVHWTVGFVAAALLAWWGWGRGEIASPERRFRWWLAVALSLYAAGQLVWMAEVIANSTPFPGPSDALETLLSPFIVVGLLLAWKMKHGAALPVGRLLDVLIVTLGCLVLTLGSYLPQQGDTEAWPLALMILYPVLLYGAAGLFLVMTLQDGTPLRSAGVVFLVSLAGDAFLWMNWNLQILQGSQSTGNPLNVLFSLLAVSLAVSGIRWVWPTAPRHEQSSGGALILLPLLGVLAAFAGSILLLRSKAVTPVTELTIASMSLIVVALAVLSQLRIVKTLRNAKETERALERLRQTQGQLARSEKLASMGQLVAGIAHELNTPLASIQSSAGILRESMKPDLSWFAEAWARLGETGQNNLLALLSAPRGETAFPDSQGTRRLRKQLEARAAEAGQAHPDAVARLLLETRLHDSDRLGALWSSQELEPILEIIEPFIIADRMADVLVQASEKAAGVVDALRNYLHVGGSEIKEEFDVAQNIESVLPLFQHRFKNGIEFRSRLEPGLRVWGAPERVSQVWVNLIANALYALSDRGTLSIETRQTENTIEVTVGDTGPGVPPELRSRIFDPFFTTKPAGEGTGMGLGVCLSILEDCGGTLVYESVPGNTRFTAKFPSLASAKPMLD